MLDISEIISEHNFHILALTETNVDSSISNALLNIDGYNIYRQDRSTGNWGGVAIYVQNHIPVKVRDDLLTAGVEAIWLQIQLPYLKPLLIGCCYRQPSANVNFLDLMCDMLDRVCDMNYEVYFLGDMNINWHMKTCSLRSKLLSCANTCNMTQVIKSSTRIFSRADGLKTSTCIDLLFTNAAELCSKAIVIPVGCSDHHLIAIARKTKVPKSGQKIIFQRMFKKFDESKYYNEVNAIDWSTVLEESDPNGALSVFYELLMPIIEKHAPLRKKTVKHAKAPWLDEEMRDQMMARDRAKAEAIRSGESQQWDTYRKMRNYVTKLNKAKKRAHYQNKIVQARLDGNMMWKTLNEMMGRKGKSTPSFIEVNGQYLTKPLDIANYFSGYFSNKIQSLCDDLPAINENNNSHGKLIAEIMHSKSCKFAFDDINADTILKIFNKSKETSPGVDNIHMKLLKPVANLIALPVAHVINVSFKSGIFPSDWKMAKVIALPKNSKESFSGKNSRPISLLPALSKIMEQITYEQIQHYFCENELNTVYQHAYKKGHSTATALAQMTDDWMTEIDENKLVGAVLLDQSAAFDVLNHRILLNKLHCYGFEPLALELVRSYLTDRKYTVYFNGSYSEQRAVSRGVPQGSSLGPLLYSIFMNDLPLILNHSTVAMYADDSTVYASACTVEALSQTLNKELELIEEWMVNNKLILNKGKTKCIMLGTTHSLKDDPLLHLKMGDTDIEQVPEVKLLGIIIDKHMTWNSQIEQIVQKMGRGLAVIKHCKALMPKHLIKQVVQAIVLSHLQYCTVIWSSTTENNLKRLQVAQNKAARLILQCPYRTHVSSMHMKLAWLTVEHRIQYALGCYMKNIIRTKTPAVLYRNLSFFSDIHSYFTRQAAEDRCLLPLSRINYKQNTTYYRAMVEWNKYPLFLVQEENIIHFKKKFKLFLFTRQP